MTADTRFVLALYVTATPLLMAWSVIYGIQGHILLSCVDAFVAAFGSYRIIALLNPKAAR